MDHLVIANQLTPGDVIFNGDDITDVKTVHDAYYDASLWSDKFVVEFTDGTRVRGLGSDVFFLVEE